MTTRPKWLRAVSLLALAAIVALAQETTFRVNVNLVRILATAKDAN